MQLITGPRLLCTAVLLAALGVAAAVLACGATVARADGAPTVKPRVIILTDGEVDDMDTFARFLYYTDDFNVAGLIYQASEWHWCGDGTQPYSLDGHVATAAGFPFQSTLNASRYPGVRHQLRCPGNTWMQGDINLYGQVQPALAANDPTYPTAAQLLSVVAVGNYDVEGEFDHDTPGSNLIEADLLDNVPGKLWVLSWGGSTTLARALLDIQNTYKNTAQWPAIYAKISSKLVYSTVQNQDTAYQNYIGPNWPNVEFILDNTLLNSWGYGWRSNVPVTPASNPSLPSLQTELKGPWMSANLLTGTGALLSGASGTYRTWGDCKFVVNDEEDNYGVNAGLMSSDPACAGPTEFPEYATNLTTLNQIFGNPDPPAIHLSNNLSTSTASSADNLNDLISEGDTPSYMFLIPNGLNPTLNPTYGSWGGRFSATTTQTQTPLRRPTATSTATARAT